MLIKEKPEAEKPVEVTTAENVKSPISKFLNGIRNGLSQMSIMLEPPHFRNACLVYTIQFCILFG